MLEVQCWTLTVGRSSLSPCLLSPDPPLSMLRWKKPIAWIAGLALIVTLVVFFSIPITRSDDAGSDFDIQVVLGGNTRERSDVSHALWLRHPTPILVTGGLDYIRDELLRLGIPASAIIQEPQARSTWENAALSVPILKQRKVKSAVIAAPDRTEIQTDGRLRLWKKIPEMDNRALRVILLEDRTTVHNAFFDRNAKL